MGRSNYLLFLEEVIMWDEALIASWAGNIQIKLKERQTKEALFPMPHIGLIDLMDLIVWFRLNERWLTFKL